MNPIQRKQDESGRGVVNLRRKPNLTIRLERTDKVGRRCNRGYWQ